MLRASHLFSQGNALKRSRLYSSYQSCRVELQPISVCCPWGCVYAICTGLCVPFGGVCAHCLWRLAYLVAGTHWSAARMHWSVEGSWRWGVLWGSWVGLILESASQSVASVAGFWDPCSSCLEPLSICSSSIFHQTMQPCWSFQWYERGEGDVDNLLQGWGTAHSLCSYLLPWEKLVAEGVFLATKLCHFEGRVT